MPITPFLEGENFDPETRRIMGVAFEAARSSLRLSDVSDRVAEIVAKKIIELAKAGERNPDVICERALAELGNAPSAVAISAPSTMLANGVLTAREARRRSDRDPADHDGGADHISGALLISGGL